MAFSNLTLVLGGVASGKSAYAEGVTEGQHDNPTYIATAQARDAEMRAKIEAHIARRGPHWQTRETPLELADSLRRARSATLVDCATLWLSNLLEDGRDPERETRILLGAIRDQVHPITIVSNEIGLGGIAAHAESRRFARAQGLMNQQIAAEASKVIFVAAGCPLLMKDIT